MLGAQKLSAAPLRWDGLPYRFLPAGMALGGDGAALRPVFLGELTSLFPPGLFHEAGNVGFCALSLCQ